MGSALPAIVGAHSASGSPLVCFESDGSLLFNVQELATIKALNIPVLLFVLNNGGYASIRNSQLAWFGDGWFGADQQSGLPNPELGPMLAGFGIDLISIATAGDLRRALASWRSQPRLQALHLEIDGSEDRLPRVTSHLDAEGKMVQSAFDELFGGAPHELRRRLRTTLEAFRLPR
jgi:acetolactate synthase-1/2/3 large subunit